MTLLSDQIDVLVPVAAGERARASALWHLVVGAAADSAALTPRDRETVASVVGELASWLPNRWFARLCAFESRAELIDWIVPAMSGSMPMRNFFAFAASAVLAHDADGADRAFKVVDGTAGSWYHVQDQLELAAQAQRSGATVSFEPANGPTRSADLAVRVPGLSTAQMLVEVTTMTKSKRQRAADDWSSMVSATLQPLVLGSHLKVAARAIEPFRGPYLSEWISRICDEAAAVGREPVTISSVCGRGTATITNLSTGPAEQLSVGCDREPEDEFERMRTRLARKVTQASDGQPTWIHFSHFGGLFFNTEFARAPLALQAQTLRAAFHDELDAPGVAGLVVATRTRLRVADGRAWVDSRTRAVRVTDDHVTHVALIVASPSTDPAEADWWANLYRRSVPGWLEWAAAETGIRLPEQTDLTLG
ncbi:MAG: hypothetical protein ACSLFI_06950 [Solirubrobacterales bacterium]